LIGKEIYRSNRKIIISSRYNKKIGRRQRRSKYLKKGNLDKIRKEEIRTIVKLKYRNMKLAKLLVGGKADVYFARKGGIT